MRNLKVKPLYSCIYCILLACILIYSFGVTNILTKTFKEQRVLRENIRSYLQFVSNFCKLQNKPLKSDSNRLIRSCLNQVEFESDISVWSFLLNDLNYVNSSIKLLKSIKTHASQIKFDTVILELREKSLSQDIRLLVKKSGWKICIVNQIRAFQQNGTIDQFEFSKLVLWNITEYKRIFYFDSDTLVINKLDNFLANSKLNKYKIGCTRDHSGTNWLETFNSGVLEIKPDKLEFENLIKLKNVKKFKSFQDFLNQEFKHAWYDFGFEYNANLVVFASDQTFWNRSNVSVVHFTASKPWVCLKEYQEICNVWNSY